MAKKPELIIGYEEDGRPPSAVCSACGEYMHQGEPRVTTSTVNIKWFSAEFKLHVAQMRRRDGFPGGVGHFTFPFCSVSGQVLSDSQTKP